MNGNDNFKRGQKVLVQEILDKLDGVKETGDQKWQALCPVHGDKKQSLSISVGDNGKPLLYCHAGCSYKDIVKTLGIDTNQKKTIKRAIVATYDYYFRVRFGTSIYKDTLRALNEYVSDNIELVEDKS